MRGVGRLGDALASGAAPAGRGEPPAFSQAGLLDAIGQAVVATDVTGRIVYANRAVVSLLGWEPGDLVGRSVLDVFLAHRPAAEATAQMRRVIAGEPLSRENAAIVPRQLGEIGRRQRKEFGDRAIALPIRAVTGRAISLVVVAAEFQPQRRIGTGLLVWFRFCRECQLPKRECA